tara:strand:- start:1266 stop:2459 length:1194 start_codon:yes stop_codon:yes gene_type:complete
MAYQNIGRPRFFVDNYMYLKALGLDSESYISQDIPSDWEGDINKREHHKHTLENPSAFTLDPINSKGFYNNENTQQHMRFHIPCGEQVAGLNFSGNMKWYIAVLNHNLASVGSGVGAFIQNTMFMKNIKGTAAEYVVDSVYGGMSPILNEERQETKNGSTIWSTELSPSDMLDDEGESWTPRYTGFQILANDAGDSPSTPIPSVRIGAISAGVMYTMPYSPDLRVKMEMISDGVKSQKSVSGSTFTNVSFLGSPAWTNSDGYHNPFGVGDGYSDKTLGGAYRTSRRTWNLKFSYIEDKDLFASNNMLRNYTETIEDYDSTDINTENQFEYNIFTDDSFIAQVWNKTLGGALPFIFQPDSTNNNPDQFCIAKFVDDSLSVSQKAYKVYEFSVKIEEVW